MRTNRHPRDYLRERPPSAEVRQKEKAIMDWIGELVAYRRRGLLTVSEFDRLAKQGPPK